MEPSKIVKIVKLNFYTEEIKSQLSIKAFEDLVSYDPLMRTSSGIAFHEELFFFGVTDKIYQTELSGNAGFLTSLTSNRKSTLFREVYFQDD